MEGAWDEAKARTWQGTRGMCCTHDSRFMPQRSLQLRHGPVSALRCCFQACLSPLCACSESHQGCFDALLSMPGIKGATKRNAHCLKVHINRRARSSGSSRERHAAGTCTAAGDVCAHLLCRRQLPRALRRVWARARRRERQSAQLLHRHRVQRRWGRCGSRRRARPAKHPCPVRARHMHVLSEAVALLPPCYCCSRLLQSACLRPCRLATRPRGEAKRRRLWRAVSRLVVQAQAPRALAGNHCSRPQGRRGEA